MQTVTYRDASPASTNCSTIKITKLSEHIGAEVTGVDLRQPVDEATRRRLNDALVENIVLAIRDQDFTTDQFQAAASVFGQPMDLSDTTQKPLPGYPLVYQVSTRTIDRKGKQKKVGIRWHTDGVQHECPQKYTTLYPLELPDHGGPTHILNMRAAYQAMPEDIKKRIAGMKTANVNVAKVALNQESVYGGLADDLAKRQEAHVEPMMHPLVRTHPENGTQAIVFNPLKVEYITGLDPEASQELMDDLLERALRPEFVYSHQWRMGDMLIWDNRSSLHRAGLESCPDDQHRTLNRICIAGDRPF